MRLIFRRLKASLLSASLVLLAAGQPVWAAAGTVSSSISATSPIQCNAATTVTLTIDGVSPPPSQVAVDVMLVLDRSGSMGGAAMTSLKNAANSFVNTMDSNDGSLDGNITTSRVGMVSFSSTATLGQALTNDANAVHTAINALVASGTTAIGDGVNLGATQLSGGTAKDVMIVMTDGQNNAGANPLTAASAAKAAGVELFTIGLGSSVNAAQLQAMATDPAHYYQAPTPDQLEGIFQQIATGVAGPAATGLTYSVQAAPGFAITSSSATKGTVSNTAGTLDWSLNELRTESLTITYTMQHTASSGGVMPVHSAATLSYTDDGGAAQSVSYTSLTVDVQGCNQPPTANAGADQTVPQDLSGTAAVTLDGSGSTDDGQIMPLTYSWYEGATLLGSGPMLNVSLPLGSHTITLTVHDGEYSASDDVSITVTDPFPPTTTATLAGTLGDNGWYRSDVTVSLSAVDNPGGSGVQDTRIDADGGGFSLYTAPVTVSGDGTHTVTYLSSDNAGNAEAPQSVTIMIDATSPEISAAQAPAANANGWNNADVTVTYTCSDATSGIASCTGPQVVSTEGAGIVVSGTAVDNAGNTAGTSMTVNLDKTGPDLTVGSPMAGEYADDAMLNIAWTAADALSGVASESATLDGAPIANGAVVDLSTLAMGTHTFVVTATDMAGNTTSITVVFEVKVTYDSLEALKHRFYELGLIKNQGIVTSLDQKLRAAKAAHERGQYGTEDSILAAFIAEVEAQAGKGIFDPATTKLMADGQWLMDHN